MVATPTQGILSTVESPMVEAPPTQAYSSILKASHPGALTVMESLPL